MAKNQDFDTVTLNLEDGDLECAVFDIVEFGEKEYIVLMPLDENGDIDESQDYFIYHYWEEDGEPKLAYIEDDEEYEMIVDRYEEMLDDRMFDEM